MEVPIWVATILVGAVLGGFSYIAKLVLQTSENLRVVAQRLDEYDRRISHLEAWRETFRPPMKE